MPLSHKLLVAIKRSILLWPSGSDTQSVKKPPANTMAPADAQAWDALCTAFYEWFGSFLADLDSDWPLDLSSMRMASGSHCCASDETMRLSEG